MVAKRTGIGRSGMDLVDEFNDPNGDKFAFLISTRAGGVGLNLKAANKVGSFSRSCMAVLLIRVRSPQVVIFDPNWNPSHDLQAMGERNTFSTQNED